ncbi:MAG TPA: hypothetical protein DEQ28_01855 [Clostridiales bacterium]|nr:hypothetical protein [Clostridiales bacterium]
MSAHNFRLTSLVPEWTQVGNSISTAYRWDGMTLGLRWKGKPVLALPASAGEHWLVVPTGDRKAPVRATRMQPPRLPAAQAAWERGWYRKGQHASRDALARAVEDGRRRGLELRREDFPQCIFAWEVFESRDGRDHTYKNFGWWISPTATPEEVAAALDHGAGRL